MKKTTTHRPAVPKKYSHNVQCETVVDGKVVIGSWLMDEKNQRVSPVFNDLCDLFQWFRANGFRVAYVPGDPFGVEKVA